MKQILLVILLCFNCQTGTNWDVLTINDKSCGMEGAATNKTNKERNRLKNRWNLPREKDFDSNFSWENILEAPEYPRKFNQSKAGKLRGYVAYVTKSKMESCNCNYREPEFHDLHINLVENEADYNDKTRHVVIEITPRLREIMKAQGIDWHFNTLKKLRHKQIEVEGWLFYDWEHGDKAFLRSGDTLNSWRATCWELHPVTALKVM